MGRQQPEALMSHISARAADVEPQDCVDRSCGCSRGHCRFEQCRQCGGLVDDHGATIDPRGGCAGCQTPAAE
jgi:hypothetical protein